uniref:Uncharacterized protein n=1 Tax=Meloidogyne incognita TaxID=6306 RepID=A0A914LQW4_MELIC
MNIHQHYYQVNEQTLNCFPNLKDEAVRMAAVYNEDILNAKFDMKGGESDNETIGLTDYGDDDSVIDDDSLSTIAASSSRVNFNRSFHYASMSSLASTETATTYSEIFGSKKERSKWEEEHDDLLPEYNNNPFKFEDLSHLNKVFDWNGWSCGVIVEQMRNPSKAVVCYKIWPFCNGETTAVELFLDTDEKREILDLGQWIKFERKDLFPAVVNPSTYQPQKEMLRTIPSLGGVFMECQIVICDDRRGEICTKMKRWLTDLQMSNCMTRTPFIRRIRDDQGLIRNEDLGTTRWATIEYIRVDEEEGCWRLVFIRPKCYGEWVSLTE